MASILIVDDEESILDFISYNLETRGHKVFIARTGRDGAQKAADLAVDLIILDVMLPDMDGFEVCKSIRLRSQVPVLMLSALDSVTDKVLGLELGADDYLSKPFSVRELLARVKALLRRSLAGPGSEVLRHGWLKVDTGRRECYSRDEPVDLTLKEFELLSYMMENRGMALSRSQIMEAVWGFDVPAGERTIDSHVKSLRRKLCGSGVPDPIDTVRGVGYKFAAEETE
ncbi:MAG: response regulator transcription factor [Actinobacteria bacterium]|nr:response regulator transcription factor [Actinomycetota bacterium]